MKSKNHRILRPKSTPLVGSTQNQAKHPKIFRNSVTVWTVESKNKIEKKYLHLSSFNKNYKWKIYFPRVNIFYMFSFSIFQNIAVFFLGIWFENRVITGKGILIHALFGKNSFGPLLKGNYTAKPEKHYLKGLFPEKETCDMSPDPRPRKKAVPATKRTRTREGKDPALRIIFFQSGTTNVSPSRLYTEEKCSVQSHHDIFKQQN